MRLCHVMSDRHKKSIVTSSLSQQQGTKLQCLDVKSPPSRTSAKLGPSHAMRPAAIMTYEHNRATGITPTRYRPLLTEAIPKIPRLPGFSFLNHHPSHAIRRPCRSSQGKQNPKKSPKSHPPSSNTRICACKPSASVSPGPERHSLSAPARTASTGRTQKPTRTIHRAAQLYPGAGRHDPGEYVRHLVLTRRSRCWSARIGCQWHGPGDSSLVAGLAAASLQLHFSATRAFDMDALHAASCAHAALHMGSCESVVGAIAEAETAA